MGCITYGDPVLDEFIHLPPILMFTRGLQGFDPQPFGNGGSVRTKDLCGVALIGLTYMPACLMVKRGIPSRQLAFRCWSHCERASFLFAARGSRAQEEINPKTKRCTHPNQKVDLEFAWPRCVRPLNITQLTSRGNFEAAVDQAK